MSFFIFDDIDNQANPLPIFLIQVFLTLILTRILGKILSYLRQPQVIGEMIGGILMGPSVLGNIPNYTKTIWPAWSINTFNVVANIGLIFFMFLMGLEVEPKTFKKVYKRSLPIALASIIFPFGVGIACSFWLYDYNEQVDDPPTNKNRTGFILFAGTSLSFTAFPVLASLLESRGLLHTTLGVQSLSMASVNDLLAWCLLALASAFVASDNPANGGYTFLIALLYVAIMLVIIKPIMSKIHHYFLIREQEDNNYFLVIIFLMLILSAFASQVIGIHAFFGSFVAGIILPKVEGNLTKSLMPKLELITKNFLLPLYFVSSGIKTDIRSLKRGEDIGTLIAIFSLAVFVKFIPSCLLTKIMMKGYPWRYCIAIGFLMNTRGLVELIALNVGLSTHILSIELFTVFVLMAILTTLMTSPMLSCFYSKKYDNIHESEVNSKNNDKYEINSENSEKYKIAATHPPEELRSEENRLEIKPEIIGTPIV